MATLVLTAVGSVFGPIGGAVGALAGQAIDGRIFAPGGREGPRLQDLKVQTSSYGVPIPKLFGTMRVAGTVIWATDLVEHRQRRGGGKGRPSSTTYSYTASFAVLLSGRAIRSVGRIWADGNLLRGAAGDWKSETGFRLHTGDDDQPPDPFIASAEGGEGTPGYCGCAYAVFEHMALGPFGNRIPSLTFEVEADAEPVSVGAMLGELSEGLIDGAGTALKGFAASGNTLRDLIATLGEAMPTELRDAETALRLVDAPDPLVTLDAAEIDEGRSEQLPGIAELPGGVSIGHYDPARDYQIGTQDTRSGGGRAIVRIELAAALAAGEAAALADQALARRWRERGRRSVRCGWARLGVAPGALVRLPDDAGQWRVASRSVDREGVRLDLRRVRFGSLSERPAAPGRSLPAPDEPHGPTVIHLLDLPPLDQTLPVNPRLYIAAAGTSPGWRRAALMVSLDQGATWDAIGQTAPSAVMGAAETVLAAAGPGLHDRVNTVDVALLHPGMMLADADEARLLAGANIAILGDELIQFGSAVPLGAGRWRLGSLFRGRRGTGWAVSTHAAGERFVLLEAEALMPYDPPIEARGTSVRVLASGIGDTAPVEDRADAIGEALRPLAPVHLSARRRADGGFDISWIRASRLGFAWLDGVDAPLGEVFEAYRLTVTPAGGLARSYALSAPVFHYSADDIDADAALGEAVVMSVVQVAGGSASRAADLNLAI